MEAIGLGQRYSKLKRPGALKTQNFTPPLPGATAFTHLKVYDTLGPDGLAGGSSHLHFACTEAYMVLAGRGAVQTLGTGGFAELPLEPGRLLWFTPGLIHRLINHDGQLEILVLMQNAGLPEAGDAVLTFPPRSWPTSAPTSTPRRWRPAGMSTPAAPRPRTVGATWRSRASRCCASASSSAASRRSTSSTRLALRLVQPKLDAWRATWEHGPLAAARRTGEQLQRSTRWADRAPARGAIFAQPAPGERKLGMCGTLGVYPPVITNL